MGLDLDVNVVDCQHDGTRSGTLSRPVEPLYGLVGAEVRAAREAAGLSQEQLAVAVGLSRTSITNLEMGRQQTPLHVLYAIAEVVGMALKDLLPDSMRTQQPISVDLIGSEDVERWAAQVASSRRAGRA